MTTRSDVVKKLQALQEQVSQQSLDTLRQGRCMMFNYELDTHDVLQHLNAMAAELNDTVEKLTQEPERLTTEQIADYEELKATTEFALGRSELLSDYMQASWMEMMAFHEKLQALEQEHRTTLRKPNTAAAPLPATPEHLLMTPGPAAPTTPFSALASLPTHFSASWITTLVTAAKRTATATGLSGPAAKRSKCQRTLQ